MELKQYLLDTFLFNNAANLQLLDKIRVLPEPAECIRLYSHLIQCQKKWMARVNQEPNAHAMSWWDPVYPLGELQDRWNESLQPWLQWLNGSTDEILQTEVTFVGFDNGIFAATPGDIALQLNYHSIHHRAQMQMMIRQQGLNPDFLDYIGRRFRKLS